MIWASAHGNEGMHILGDQGASMNTAETMKSCAICGGLFSVPRIVDHGQLYCYDKCANMHQHKFSGFMAMAPKLMVVLSVGAIIGYLIRGE